MDKEMLKRFTEVKETVATGFELTDKRRFTSADLWRIHQAKKQPARITRRWAL
jgi:hypothetical protein